MHTLGEVMFNPSGLDSRANYLGDELEDQQDWLVLACRTRDADLLTESNWDCALQQLGGEGADVEVIRFGHWACGWLEYLAIRPETEAARIAGEIEEALEDYPVLDEQDYSDREYEAVCQRWQDMNVRERLEAIRDHGKGVSPFAARRDELPRDDWGHLFEYLRTE